MIILPCSMPCAWGDASIPWSAERMSRCGPSCGCEQAVAWLCDECCALDGAQLCDTRGTASAKTRSLGQLPAERIDTCWLATRAEH